MNNTNYFYASPLTKIYGYNGKWYWDYEDACKASNQLGRFW